MQDESRRYSEERAKARAASLGCDLCHGEGMLEVYHRDYRGRRVIDTTDSQGHPIRVAGVVAAHCNCPMGRWMRESVSPEDKRRIVDVLAILSGRSTYTIQDPTEPPVPKQILGMTKTDALAWLNQARARATQHRPSKDIQRETRPREPGEDD